MSIDGFAIPASCRLTRSVSQTHALTHCVSLSRQTEEEGMPDWCANILTIKGHEARLLEFRCVAITQQL